MPRNTVTTLTDVRVENANAPNVGVVEIFDREMPGMCLRISNTNRKTYVLTVRTNEINDRGIRRQRRVTVGQFLSKDKPGLAEARAEALRIKTLIEKREDRFPPITQNEPAPAPGPTTFGAVAEMYIKRECRRLVRGAEIESLIRRELLPHWGDRPITELRKRDGIARTDALMDLDKPAAAHGLYETLKRIFNWALDRDEIDNSPFAAMKPPTRIPPRTRVLNHGEIRAVWPAFEAAGYPYGSMLQLLLLTGQRRNEIAGMRWAEIDLEKRNLTIPAGRTKSDREHIVPLSEMAVAILNELPRFAGGEFVFTSTEGRRPISGYSKAKVRLDKRVNIAHWRFHDLRRTVRTELARLGVPEIVSERVIGHGPRGLVAIYNMHQYTREKRDALDRWARELHDIVTPPPDNVVRLPASGAA